MFKLSSDSKDDLISKLGQIDISVPYRAKGRTKGDTEKWSACRFICANLNSSWVTYPIEAQLKDRPDLRIKVADRVIGVEITEVISQNAAAIDAYRIHNEIKAPFLLNKHLPGDEKVTQNELISLAKGEVSSSGWEGGSVELEWASAMLDSLKKKNENARKPGYRIYNENWLLIYDNWHLPGLDLKLGIKYLSDELTVVGLGVFGKVFIEHSDMLVCIEDTLSYILPIPNVCKSS